MASVDRNGCDGCGGEFTAAELYSVTLPNGEDAVCCPECRKHAKDAARKWLVSQGTCDGCGDRHPPAKLERIRLPDDVTINACPRCRRKAPTGGSSRSATGPSDGTGRRTASRSAAGAGGTAASRRSSDSATTPRQSDGSSGSASGPSGRTNACDQCGGDFSIELFEVETVDGRTEHFCPDCKRDGIEDGIISTVRMRKAEAFEILGIEGGADPERIRDVYLAKVRDVHPDNGGSREAFKRIQRAYERLSS